MFRTTHRRSSVSSSSAFHIDSRMGFSRCSVWAYSCGGEFDGVWLDDVSHTAKKKRRKNFVADEYNRQSGMCEYLTGGSVVEQTRELRGHLPQSLPHRRGLDLPNFARSEPIDNTQHYERRSGDTRMEGKRLCLQCQMSTSLSR